MVLELDLEPPLLSVLDVGLVGELYQKLLFDLLVEGLQRVDADEEVDLLADLLLGEFGLELGLGGGGPGF